MHPASLALAIFAALLPQADPAPAWERVQPDLELVYPRDHGAHHAQRIEWWYVTGQVDSDDGRAFGFQFTVFRSGLDRSAPQPDASPLRARQVLAGHLAITDISGQRTHFAERLRRTGSPLAFAATTDLDLAVEDWSLARDSTNRLLLRAHDPATAIGLELDLEPTKALVRHGQNGYSSKGSEPGNASAYVSWTRLATAGRLTIDGAPVHVRGSAWFDHEFGTSVLEAGVVGWDWFGLHLDDGRELMIFTLRRADGTRTPASAGTLVAADGGLRRLGGDDFRLRAGGRWVSPRTAGIYPNEWSLEIPAANLSLTLVTRVPDCELGALASSGVAYWEGPVEVSGTTTGRGYAELTGYAGSMEGKL